MCNEFRPKADFRIVLGSLKGLLVDRIRWVTVNFWILYPWPPLPVFKTKSINFAEDFNRSFLELRLDLKSPELELELKLKPLELELELELIVSSGIGIENNGIGIRIELKKWNWPQPCPFAPFASLLSFQNIFCKTLKNPLVTKRTIYGRTLGHPVDSWVTFGDQATIFQQHCLITNNHLSQFWPRSMSPYAGLDLKLCPPVRDRWKLCQTRGVDGNADILSYPSPQQYPLPQGHIVGVTIRPAIPKIQFDLENSRSKVKVKGTPVSASSSRLISFVFHIWHFTSGHPIDSHPFRSMKIVPPIPEIQFDLENSRSKVNVKGTPVSTASSWLISSVFHIRESYWLPSLSFHDNRSSHSRDTIWPWKFKVKGQCHINRPISCYYSHLVAVRGCCSISHVHAGYIGFHIHGSTHGKICFCLNQAINPHIEQILTT